MDPPPMCTTLRFLDTLLSVAKPQRGTTEYADLACELSRRGYGAIALQQTFRCLDEGFGIADCWWIRECDREAVSNLLPSSECHGGCVSCKDEAEYRRGLLEGRGA
jgi:hypothetical protein